MKQFEVNHSKSANKVGVDGVIVGAWANLNAACSILDAGCGCGLISMMVAQRSEKAQILGIDIDEEAVLEARDNVENSKWGERIHIEKQDFTDLNQKFDLIISNPPFFNSGIKQIESSRELARHAGSLSPEALIRRAKSLLNPNGKLIFIAHADDENDLICMGRRFSLELLRITRVRGTMQGPIKRILMEWQYGPDKEHHLDEDFLSSSYESTELIIETSPGLYTPEYIDLCKDFYLKF